MIFDSDPPVPPIVMPPMAAATAGTTPAEAVPGGPPIIAPPAPPTGAQRAARVMLATALVLLGLWILHEFLGALAWAAVIAIASWPLYRRLERALPASRIVAPLLTTVLIGLIFVGPFVYLAVILAREVSIVIGLVVEAQRSGIGVPAWIANIPGGHSIGQWWQAHLSDPAAAHELLGHVDTKLVAQSAREYGSEIMHRLTVFGFTLLTLFFLFREGRSLNRDLLALSDRMLGVRGEQIASQMIQAVRGTLNGLVLVGLGEGVVLGVAYVAVGVPHPVLVATATGIFAVIPFGAPVVFGLAALFLLAQGSTGAAIAVLVTGFAVLLAADHMIRPIIIGGAVRLPFLWVLLGILGGLGTFGVLGLFLGPAVMAALMMLWREWTGPQTQRAAAISRRRGRTPVG